MGGVGSGVSKSRLLAVAVLSANAWGIGTVLVSDAWRSPRTVIDVSKLRVKLRDKASGDAFVKSFPKDVRLA